MDLTAAQRLLKSFAASTFLLLSSMSLYAIAITSPPQTAPFALTGNNTLSVDSGTMATSSASALGYSVDFSGATAPGLSVTIKPGATLSYQGTNGNAGALSSIRSDAVAVVVTNNLNIDGTLTAGTGLYAIYLNNTGAAASDTHNINISNTAVINGNIASSGVLHTNINITGSPTITGVIALGTSASGTSNLIVGASGTASFTPTYAITDITNLQVINSSTMTLGVNNDIANVTVGSGSILNIIETLGGAAVGDGNIANNGTMNIYANIEKTGNFTGSGTNKVFSGGSTGLSVTTNNYRITNHVAVLQDVNTYGNITLSTANLNLNNGGTNSFAVQYGTAAGVASGYFPSGTYTLATTTLGTVTSATYSSPPASTLFLSFGTPFTDPGGKAVKITITRTPYNTFATTPFTQAIATNLESIGASSPTSTMVSLLNAIEQATTASTLESNLEALAPLSSPPTYGYQVQNDTMRQAKLRLAQLRSKTTSYIAGDYTRENHAWIRPFGIYGNQQPKDDSFGYYGTTGGVIGGFDRELDDRYTLGGAFAYTVSHVKEKFNPLSSTEFKSYLAMIYGTYNITQNRYVDWVLSLGTNNFNATRVIDINSLNATALSSYHSQQGSVNCLYGEDFEAFGFMQLTPEAYFQYSFTKQYPYTESGATGANLSIDRSNSNIVSVGLGGTAAMPVFVDPSIILPQIHAWGLYNPVIGKQNTTFSFSQGGPMYSNFTLSRWDILIGAAFTIGVPNKMEIKLSADYELKDRYKGYNVYLNLRYFL